MRKSHKVLCSFWFLANRDNKEKNQQKNKTKAIQMKSLVALVARLSENLSMLQTYFFLFIVNHSRWIQIFRKKGGWFGR